MTAKFTFYCQPSLHAASREQHAAPFTRLQTGLEVLDRTTPGAEQVIM